MDFYLLSTQAEKSESLSGSGGPQRMLSPSVGLKRGRRRRTGEFFFIFCMSVFQCVLILASQNLGGSDGPQRTRSPSVSVKRGRGRQTSEGFNFFFLSLFLCVLIPRTHTRTVN